MALYKCCIIIIIIIMMMSSNWETTTAPLYREVQMRFDTLNRLGVDHECDGQTDGQTERPLAITRYNEVTHLLKISMLKSGVNCQCAV